MDYDPGEREYITFIGSNFPPNQEAVRKIVEVAEEVEDGYFVIMGNICNYLKSKDIPRNIDLRGYVNEEEKEDIYRNTKIALNPIYSGSGSNIKVLEYFEYGLPVLSTRKGARGGFKEYCKISDFQESSIKGVCRRDEELRKLSNKAKEAGEKYAWDDIAEKILESMI
jgi:glycosyltransferase involved in cell wall biosynthesis